MPFLLLYIIKFSISLAVVFLFYQLVLRKLTFYNWNRLYLVGYTLLSFFIPFIDISGALQQNKLSDNQLINWLPVFQLKGADRTVEPGMGVWDVLSVLLVAGILVMAFRLCMQFISYYKMVNKATIITKDGMNLYRVNENIIPFSFGNSIFINVEQHTQGELQEIIRHEMVHVKQKHSIDIIWSELFCIVNWFNPFAWLIRKAIRQNLEFIADNNVLNNGIDPKQYQYLLLKVIGNKQFSIAQQFNFSSLKKRIAMMNKLKSAKINLLRFLFVLPLLATILLAFRKQMGDSNKPYNDAASVLQRNSQDTIPIATTFSDKGYTIEIFKNSKKDNPLIIVSDKNKKELTRLTIDEWNSRKDYYEKLYGELPPPPPPMAPTPPTPVKLPATVQKININNDKATVWLKNGSKENYDLTIPAQKEKFENIYGEIIPPPPPPPPPVESRGKLSFVNDIKGNIEYIEVWPTNGNVEKYSMNNPKEKEAFEKKYGKIPSAPQPAKVSAIELPAAVSEREVPVGSLRELPVDQSVIEERKVQAASGYITINDRPAKIITAIQGNPLYVLDGTIINKATLDNLNPATIASVDVLKGSSAVSQYGAKASEGVIVIKTKGTAVSDKVYITANEVHQSANNNSVTLRTSKIEMSGSNALVILDGKEVPAEKRKLSGDFNVVTLTKDEAIKKYGDKGKNGATEITTIN